MTQTLDGTAETTETPRPQQRVDAWLAGFEAALAARDVAARQPSCSPPSATGGTWCRSRWNLTTVEGREGVGDLLERDPGGHRPVRVRDRGAADEADGVVTAWILFETAVGRGRGLLRLIEEDGEGRP